MRDAVRKPLGGLAIVAGLALYAALVAWVAGAIGGLHVLVQGLLYLALGLAWVPLFAPFVRWIETGRFTKAAKPVTPTPARRD